MPKETDEKKRTTQRHPAEGTFESTFILHSSTALTQRKSLAEQLRTASTSSAGLPLMLYLRGLWRL
eukprot:4239800-Amphidinium_carterae.1